MLADLVTKYDCCYLSRAAGLGATLLCSQLEELFAHGVASFEVCAIHDTWPETKTYPVIRLSLNEVSELTRPGYKKWLKERWIEAYQRAGFEVPAKTARTSDMINFLKVLPPLSVDQEVVFLIDGWDANFPLFYQNADACYMLQWEIWEFIWDFILKHKKSTFHLDHGPFELQRLQVVHHSSLLSQ